ncbi:DUF1127 domain-containing protein [Marinobacterium mangrovicola]|uniref:Uncharacterized protein DUF1127 n=1 Tax=Marinobacterium mangrovicola TaxID=1476959 RepID=A0A4R1GFY8_9GAMM|nr:DUF1127 domain-containing protein [Marinobacterium mangrovicola]TCK07357.1 uncharacterized protein DUF1127 [Marinobacterium mangrovicola]
MNLPNRALLAYRSMKFRYRLHLTRRKLLTLDDHQLKDLNISRADAVREGKKPFWKM